MRAGDEVRRFVREVLGCGCPDEVFQQLSVRSGSELDAEGTLIRQELELGGRLLIHAVAEEAFERDAARFEHLVREGIRLRDRRGLNRYRVVLLAADPKHEPATLRQRWAACAGQDVRAHLHVVHRGAWPFGT